MEVAQLLRDADRGANVPGTVIRWSFPRLLLEEAKFAGERHLKVMVEPVGGGPLRYGIYAY